MESKIASTWKGDQNRPDAYGSEGIAESLCAEIKKEKED